jgi:hypothetical protein
MNNPFYDIALDAEQDMDFSTGDITFALSDQQNIDDILISFPGEWKQYPQVGVGLPSFLNGSQGNKLIADSKLQLIADGFIGTPIVTLNNSILEIDTSNITR